MVDADPSISRVHATLAFEPSSRTYELSVLGRAGATVDGHRLQKGAVVRVGNGSCVRIGRAEFCVLMPARLPNPPPPTATLALPALAGAGTSAEPALPPVRPPVLRLPLSCFSLVLINTHVCSTSFISNSFMYPALIGRKIFDITPPI